MYSLFQEEEQLLLEELKKGTIKIGETIEIVGFTETKTTTVTGVEMFRKEMEQGQAGDNCGILLRGIKKEDVERGQVLCKPKLLLRIQNSDVKFISFLKRKVEDILHSSQVIDHNSM